MSNSKNKNRISLLAPIVAAVMLGGLAVETYSRPVPADAEPYHAYVYSVYKALPMSFGDWVGREIQTTPEAIKLLRPNVIFTREFTHRLTYEKATFLLVQCKDARDIYGHYPRNCYPAQGYEFKDDAEHVRAFDWEVDGLRFTGTEYVFTAGKLGTDKLVVDNFIILPDGRIVPDMTEVGRSSSDYLKRFYGAAQVQVVFRDTFAEDDVENRKRVFKELVSDYMSVIQAIRTGAQQDRSDSK